MSVELLPGQFAIKPEERELFEWFETDLQNRRAFVVAEHYLLEKNPVLYHIISSAASELAPNDPKSHGTYFRSLLLLATEMDLVEIKV